MEWGVLVIRGGRGVDASISPNWLGEPRPGAWRGVRGLSVDQICLQRAARSLTRYSGTQGTTVNVVQPDGQHGHDPAQSKWAANAAS